MALHLLAGVLEERGKPLAARFARHVASDPVEASRQHSVLSLQDYSREQMQRLKKGPVYALTPGLTASGHHVNLAVKVGDHVHSFGGFFSPEHAAALLGGFAREGGVPQDGHALGGRAMRLAEAGRDLDPPPLKDYQPEAPEQDWRPNEMLPEDYHSYGRKRKYARYSEVASHPDVLGLMRFSPDHHAGSLEHGVLADRIEELGFPTIAGHIRSAKAVSPRPYLITGMSLEPTMAVQLRRGQPVASLQGWGMNNGERTIAVSLRLPAGDGKYHQWQTGLMPASAAAKHLRALAAEGVGVQTTKAAPPYRTHVVNTDESAARRFGRKKPRSADFLTAVRVLRGSGQKRLHAVAEDIARGLGLSPAKTRDALLDGPRGALPGVAQAVAGADPHTARYAAAWYGLLARTPSLGLFHVRPDGPDSLYKFHVRGSAHTARRVLDRHGIAARVLLPHGAGYDVVVPDPGRRMRANTLKAAGHLGGRVEESVGHLEPLGHADPAQARSAFRKIVERYEGGRR